MKIKESRGDRIFYGFVFFMICFLSMCCIYPLWLVIVNSISDPLEVARGRVWLLPKGFGFDAYKEAFKDTRILGGYWQTILQTIVGTAVNMALTIPAAYGLSKKGMPGRGFFMTLIVITMYFGGGLIPSYINVSNLGLLNNWWVLPLIGAVASYNLVIARTFFSSGVPRELEESAEIDGCSIPGTFFKIVLPQVIKRIMAPMSNEVITLVKDTSLARIIANKEIIMMAQEYVSTNALIWPLFSTAIFFLVACGILTILLNMAEKKLNYFRG
jgi:putative aldouronate transport system permease protein